MKNILDGKMEGRRPRGRPLAHSVVRQHQGVVRAQLSRMYEIGQSEREVWHQISNQTWTQESNEIDLELESQYW